MKTSSIDVFKLFYKLVNFMEDCPVLDRLYDFCLCQTAGTVAAAC